MTMAADPASPGFAGQPSNQGRWGRPPLLGELTAVVRERGWAGGAEADR